MDKRYIDFLEDMRSAFPKVKFGIKKEDVKVKILFYKPFNLKVENKDIESEVIKSFNSKYKEVYETVEVEQGKRREVKNCSLNNFKTKEEMDLLLMSKEEAKSLKFIDKVKKRRLDKKEIKKEYKQSKKVYDKNHTGKKILRWFRNIFLFLLVSGLIFGIASFAYVYPHLMDAKEKSTNLEMGIKEGTFTSLKDTLILDKNDNELAKIKKMDYQEVKLEDTPEAVFNGYVAVEDRRFKTHFGVDFKAIIRAAVDLVESKIYGEGKIRQGGSTITMQVVKNALIQDQSKSFERKMIELFLAPTLEKRYSKAQIMNFYINTNHYGNNVDGLGSAAKYYLGKDVKDLTIAESAMFVGISNRPSAYNPKDNLENAYEKRNFVLKIMFEQGYITKEEYEEAVEEEIKLNIEQKNQEPEKYYTSYAIHDAAQKLMKKDGFKFKYIFDSKQDEEDYRKKYEEAYFAKSQDIRAGGYVIKTTIDLEKQAQLQEVLDQGLSKYQGLQENGKYAMQGSAVYVNNESGFVEAIIGGRGTTDVFNRGFLANRQPGSAIKPFLVYGPAYETGQYYPSKVLVDEEVANGPKNATGRYMGAVSMRESFKHSINTIAHKIIKDVGIKESMGYLSGMEFGRMTYYDTMNDSMALGGMSYGTNTLEMSKAMFTMFNDGEYTDAGTVKSIEHQKTGVMFEEKDIQRRQVYEPDTAYMVLDNMSQVGKPGGTGANLGLGDKNVVMKTGTTNNQKDTWLVGGDVDKSIAVWIGYDQPKKTNEYGSTLAGPIWKNMMLKMGISEETFKRPETIVEKFVDQKGNPTDKNTGKKDIFSNILKEEAAKRKQKETFENRKTEQKTLIKISEGKILSLKNYDVKHYDSFQFLENELKVVKDNMKKIDMEEFENDKKLILKEVEMIEEKHKDDYAKYEEYVATELKVSAEKQKEQTLENIKKELNALENFNISNIGSVNIFNEKVERIRGQLNGINSADDYRQKLDYIVSTKQADINIAIEENNKINEEKRILEENQAIKNKNDNIISNINSQLKEIDNLEKRLQDRLKDLEKLEEDLKNKEAEIENQQQYE